MTTTPTATMPGETGPGAAHHDDDTDVVAIVGTYPVTAGELQAFAARLRNGPYASVLPTAGIDKRRFDRWTLQLLIREALVLQHADQLHGVRVVDVPRTTLADAVRQAKTQVTAHVRVTNEAVADYYRRNAEQFTAPERRRVRHVLCRDRAAAVSVLRRARRGADFAALARDCSEDGGSAARGGDLGRVCRGELPTALDDAVFAARAGSPTGPVPSRLGWHVFRVEQILSRGRQRLDEVRAAVTDTLLEEARSREFRAWLDRASSETVRLAAGFEHPGDPTAAEPSHRH